ncbi:stage III sporulation protein AH [Salsuginibacillus halophilus]|uniref:Stage III sporulation protein AH n=1 Tax=Salsuginibacillus halophilus TaxID=517424 RepID=A0A2P8HAE0_9BACI|nr:SpoIIIAH-like family protein [Salsuginibacillus halophilus]PSL43193.1 stage III sporulation protein AH [Salsuginibacillus halophilus]
MVLKKQTVWLLTMVSLLVVLGVYYLTAPMQEATDEMVDDGEEVGEESDAWAEWVEENPDAAVTIEGFDDEPADEEDPALEEEEEELTGSEEEDPALGEEEPETKGGTSVETEAAGGALFAELRMERAENRSRMQESYTEQIASEELSAGEKHDVHEEKEALQRLMQQEEEMERQIQAEGYPDAVVMAEGEETRILVQAESLSRDEAVKLNRMAAETFGTTQVAVGYHQP